MSNRIKGYKTAAGTVVAPAGRLSYAQFLLHRNPEALNKKTGQGKFTCSLLLPPDADLTLLKEQAAAAVTEFFGSNVPKGIHSPFLDAAEKVGEQWDGWTLLRLSANQQPQVVDARGESVSDEQEVYSGRWAHISLRAGGWDVDKKKGVSFYISNVQLLEHDEPLGGTRVAAEKEFSPVEGVDTGSSGKKTAANMFD